MERRLMAAQHGSPSRDQKARRVGPHSRAHRLLKLDGRTREAALLRRTRDDLLDHLGHSPSAVEVRLVERAALLSVYIGLMDRRALQSGGLSERDARQYLAFSNTYARC